MFTSLSCCNSSTVSFESELNFDTQKISKGRLRSEGSFHTASEERTSTNASNYRSNALLEIIYEDDFSIDLEY